MAILILNRFSQSLGHYEEWLQGIPEKVLFFTSSTTASQYHFDNQSVFEHFRSNWNVELEAIRLFEHRPFHTIIALDEAEILRAARLREYLGLNGQNVESATAYRDKTVMKTLLQKGGIRVPQFARATSSLDIIGFVNTHGFPVIIKPVDGMASRKVTVVQDEGELKEFFRAVPDEPLDIEEFVEGDMYTVDGLIVDHHLAFYSASKYDHGCLSHLSNKTVMYHLLDSGSDYYRTLGLFIQRVIEVLPSPRYSSFHAEVFIKPDGELVLCEIGSRTGGAQLGTAVNTAYGVDLDGTSVRLQVLRPNEKPHFPAQHRTLSGGVFLPQRKGTLVSIPDAFPFDWVMSYVPWGSPGKTFSAPQSSIDCVGSIVVEGATEEVVTMRLNEALNWFETHVVWSTATQEAEKL